MPLPVRAELLPRTEDEYEFEGMVRDALAIRRAHPDTQHHGRRGQKQRGVDVYGNPATLGGKYFVAQCKNYFSKCPTEALVTAEAEAAETFGQSIEMMYFATATPRDANVQKMFRKLSTARTKAGKFAIEPLFWEDIRDELCRSDEMIRKYWGALLSSSPGTVVCVDTAIEGGPGTHGRGGEARVEGAKGGGHVVIIGGSIRGGAGGPGGDGGNAIVRGGDA